ncbi:rhomboid family intramembrane serine protease [Wenjunlia tyrosinilytica]|uniref:Rhomboid family intramembrane serine protease n=1 Tax=Wenjunlia tyrosinilytica TaxID=1544741 RepID=A0A917ZL43_9ACTN|nr:rhomboid family intramembrane serine protease [Wenjunlia tyrosinilytica]GGO86150.1 rhomboid family intramembrane serine protease [Wenjunlia tyrosinilytica]
MDGAPQDGVPATQQTCYRHPGREANVRCTRCERPVCPECMVSASVGFQCPECVSAGSAGGREPRTRYGGRVVSGTAAVTKSLIAVNLVVYLLAHFLSDKFVIPLQLVGGGYYEGHKVGVAEGPDQWYRLVTAIFTHQSLPHLALNMLSLWWIGPPVEAALGRIRFLALYVLAGLGGSALSFVFMGPGDASLGASGAIFGLLGAIGVLVKRVGGDMRPIATILVLNLVFTFAWAGIDWRAHIGGLVFGAAIAFGMTHGPRERRTQTQVVTCALAVAAIVAMVCIGVADFPAF